MAHRLIRGELRGAVKNLVQRQRTRFIDHFPFTSARNFATGARQSPFEGSVILRLIRDEIQYELHHSPAFEPVPEFNWFVVDGRPGEQWIQLSRKFRGNEHIKIEATMFEKKFLTKKSEDTSVDMNRRITLVIGVFKGEDEDILEFVCTAWQDGVVIHKVYTRGRNQLKDQSYIGPEFKELSDELQDSLYDFLGARGIDDELAEFLHKYMSNKDKNEYLHWMKRLESFIQKK